MQLWGIFDTPSEYRNKYELIALTDELNLTRAYYPHPQSQSQAQDPVPSAIA